MVLPIIISLFWLKSLELLLFHWSIDTMAKAHPSTQRRQNLRYLSSKQALFDLAVFRQRYQESLNLKPNKTGVDNPWFVFGISYSEALNAWFHLKFRHLKCGSLASSSVVLAVYNFTKFDQQLVPNAKLLYKKLLILLRKGWLRIKVQ